MRVKYARKPSDKELHLLYEEKGLNISDIRRMTGAAHNTIRFWLLLAGIKPKTQSEACLGRRKLHREGVLRAAELRRKHKIEGRHGSYRSRADGYVELYMPGHPMSKESGYVMEHRIVFAGFIGRNLKPSEVVHHKNGDRKDNRIENLELIETQASHVLAHPRNRDSLGRFS